MNKKKVLMASVLVVLFAAGIVIMPITPLGDSQENELGTTPDFNLQNESILNSVSSLANGESNPSITAKRHDIINETKPLKIWVKLENGNWYNSTDLTDLSQVTPQNVVYYVIETPYGYVGYYVKETDTEFGHCPIVYSPILANGTAFKEPVGGIFLKLWVKVGGQWYQKYITSRNLGYDYRQYMTWEVIDSKTWQLGFNITNMELTVAGFTRQFDIYVGIQVHQDDKFVNIKQQVTPKNDYQDIALEWQMLSAPNFVGTELDLTYVRVANETWDKVLPLSQYADVTTEIPNYIQTAELMGANNVTYHTFNFDDLASYGLNGSQYFRVEETAMPDGVDKYVVRVAATKNASINADETLDIDPSISITDETSYYEITTNTYTMKIGMDDMAAVNQVTINGHDTYGYSWTTNARLYCKNTTGGSSYKNSNTFDSPTFTINGNNTWRIVLEAYEDIEYADQSLTLRYNVTYTFYDDFVLYDLTYMALSGSWSSIRHSWAGWRYGTIGTDGYGDCSAYYNGSHWTRMEPKGSNWGMASNWQVLMLWDNNSYTEILAPIRIADWTTTESWQFRPDSSGNNAAWSLPQDSLEKSISQGNKVSFVLGFVVLDEGGNNDDTATVGANILPYYNMINNNGSIGSIVSGSVDLDYYNESLYRYTITASDNDASFTFEPDSNIDYDYTTFLIDGYTTSDLQVSINSTTKTNGTDYLATYDSTNTQWLCVYNETISGDTTFAFTTSGDTTAPTITYDGVPANDSNIEDGTAYNLNWSFDENANWTLYRNATNVASESNSDQTANHTTSTDLAVGNVYNYTLDAEDAASNNATSSVFFTVVDTTVPVDDSPADMSYEEGASGNSITWTITELNPKKYNITRNGAQVQNDTYTDTITIDVDGLAAASYTFICYYNDTSSNSASDTVIVTVTSPAPGGGGGGGSQGSMTIVVNYADSLRQGTNLKITIVILDSSNLQRMDNVQVIVIFLANRTTPKEQADKSYTMTLKTKDLELGEYSFEVQATKSAYDDAKVTKPFTITSGEETAENIAEAIDTYGGAALVVGGLASLGLGSTKRGRDSIRKMLRRN